MPRLVLLAFAAAALVSGCAPTANAPAVSAGYGGPAGTGGGRCGLINIGTPSDVRLVHDPACSFGSN